MLKQFKFAWETTCVVDPAGAPTKGGVGFYSFDPDDLDADMVATLFCNAGFDERIKLHNFCTKLQDAMDMHGYTLRFAYKEIPDEIFDEIVIQDP